jgi:hypothetical protein
VCLSIKCVVCDIKTFAALMYIQPASQRERERERVIVVAEFSRRIDIVEPNLHKFAQWRTASKMRLYLRLTVLLKDMRK